MPEQIPSLWHTEIRSKARSPWSVLRAQAEALALQTDGILLASVTKKLLDTGIVELSFDIVVPALDGYRHTIMKVAHDQNFPYPAFVNAGVFESTGRTSYRWFLEGHGGLSSAAPNRAASDDEFVSLVMNVLRSPQVVSIAQSLVARASDALVEADPAEAVHGDSLETPAAASSVDEDDSSKKAR